MNDDVLLEAIAALDAGTIANIIQAASEYGDHPDKPDMAQRLGLAYYELTNAETDVIGLR